MAAVDIWLTSGHRPKIQKVKDHLRDGDIRPACTCGWAGPAYGGGDRHTAILGARAHVSEATRKGKAPRKPFHLVLLTTGSGRIHPGERLRSCRFEEVPDGWPEDWPDPLSWLATP